jgi:hypothetical protein
MVFPLKFLAKDARISTTQPPAEHQTFSNQERRSGINTMKYCGENCKRNPSFNKDSMANTRRCPRDILSEGLNIASKKNTRTEQPSSAGLWIVGAGEDPGGPGLVGGGLVGFRQDLAALAAPPALELIERSRSDEMMTSKIGEKRMDGECLRDVDWLVELAGADVLGGGGGVVLPAQLHVPRRVAQGGLLRHGYPTNAGAGRVQEIEIWSGWVLHFIQPSRPGTSQETNIDKSKP